MKKISLFSFCVFLLFTIKSQTPYFYGVKAPHWASQTVVFKTDINGDNLVDVDSLLSNYGASPEYITPCASPSGKIYSVGEATTTTYGIQKNIYEYDPLTNKQKLLWGSNDYITCLIYYNGSLFGTTKNGGDYNYGYIFEYDLTSKTHSKLLHFDGSNGKEGTPDVPYVNSSGELFISSKGGKNNKGVFVQFDLNSKNITKQIDYDDFGVNGSGPLVQASNGKVYGITNNGSTTSSIDRLFEIDLSTDNISIQHNFNGDHGYYIYSNLVEASAGKLYGVASQGGTSYGYGTIFEYNISANTITKRYEFTQFAMGPHTISLFGNGKLYGTTESGGSKNGGVLYEFNPTTFLFSVLYNFDPYNFSHAEGDVNEGSKPMCGVVQSTNGKLYGITNSGGHYRSNSSIGGGVLYEYDLSLSKYTRKLDLDYRFGAATSALLHASNGKLYGLTGYGGLFADGCVFEHDMISNKTATLYNFPNGSSIYPSGNIYEGDNGWLYAIGRYGGSNNKGVIFRFNLNSKTYEKLIDFGGAIGANPYSGLISGGNNKLYGVTYGGGNYNNGTLYEYDPATNSIDVKFHFDGGELGKQPTEQLLLAANGKIYGVSDKAIFEFDPATGTSVKKATLNYTAFPYPSSLVQHRNGKIYGTSKGGTHNKGVLFEYDIINDAFTIITHFDGVNSDLPFGNLLVASNDKLYGKTTLGVLEYDLYGGVLTTKQTENLANRTNLIEICYPTTSSITESVCDSYTAPDGQVYITPGIKTAIIRNTVGCDSTITIDLTIFYTNDLDLSIIQSGNTLIANASGAAYQWIDCDNSDAPISGETNQSFTPSVSGNYAVIVSQNGCTNTTECQNITVLASEDFSATLNMTRLYPNPNNGSFTLAFGTQLTNATIHVKDILGKTVYSTQTSGDKLNIQLTQAKGIYFVSIQTEQGERAALKLVIE